MLTWLRRPSLTSGSFLGLSVLITACGGSSEPDDDPDPVPPAVDSIVPNQGAASVEVTGPLRIYFHSAVNASTVTAANVTLTKDGTPIPATVSYDAVTMSASLTGPLVYSTTYALTATTRIESPEGTELEAPVSSTFTTRNPRTITLNPMAPGQPMAIVARPNGGMAIMYTWNQAVAIICDADCSSNGSGTTVAIDSIAGSYGGDIAIDGNGVLHATFTDPNTDRLHYARCAAACSLAASWSTTVVDSSVYAHFANAIAVDGNTVHIIYDASGPSDVRYATCSAACTTYGGWTRGAAETAGTVGGIHDLIVHDGTLYTSWFDYTAQRLRYATCTTGCTAPAGWTSTPIDQAGTQGAYPTLGVGPAGTMYVAYSTTSPALMTVASCTAACTTAANWTRTTIEDAGGTGPTEGALLVGPAGRLGLVHFRVSTADVRYSTCTSECTLPSSWRSTALDANGDVGYHPTATLNAQGGLQATYIGGGLKYAE